MKYVLAIFAAFAVSPAAHAYIPPSQFIVKNLATKHAGYKALRIRTQVLAMDGDRPSGTHFKAITLFDAKTRVIRVRAYDDAGKELYAIERRLPAVVPKDPDKASVTPPAETTASAPVEPLPVVDTLLFESDLDSLSKLLKASGIPIKTEAELLELADEEARRSAESLSLGRWKGASSWIIGQESKDSFPPQLWVEKDSFLPIRMLSKGEDGTVDVRLENYRFVKEYPVPRAISAVRLSNGKETILLREDLEDASVNPTDLSELKGTLSPGYTEAGNMADSAVRELIRNYFQYLR